LIGCILLTKSLSCNVVVFTGMPYIPESSKYLEFICLRWKGPYYDKFQCPKLQEGYSNVQGRFCADSNSQKLDHLFPSRQSSKASGCSSVSNIVWTMWYDRPNSHQCQEAPNSSRFHLSGHHGNTSRRSLKFNKN
jgi:hypothetical protein